MVRIRKLRKINKEIEYKKDKIRKNRSIRSG